MTKRIDVGQLRPGMYIADLGSDWMAHPFLRSSFAVKDQATIRKIVEAGIHEVYIDPDKGLDVPEAPTRQEVVRQLDEQMRRVAQAPARPPRVSTVEELGRAQKVHSEANNIIRNMMHDVRLGKQVSVEAVEPVVERVTESILRNGGALLSLCQVKNKDDYTFQHSVSVCTLLVAFCHAVGLDDATVRLAGIGGMLHDIGKVRMPDAVLNKPGRLTEDEFDTMKRHVVESKNILEQTAGIAEVSMQIAYEHHERYDGSGYAQGLKGDQISRMGQMAAICDVYDAITSNRVYHQGMAPHEALRKIFEWSKFHFNPALVQQFLRTIGIYPVGTLVMLESGRVGVVLDQYHENLLQPLVRVFYDSKSRQYIPPQELDLAKPVGAGGADRIVSHETPEKWGIDPSRYR
ncbi:MAG TPA: HD-GYP domain-containing protein [Rhodocyclaceae bacterium]|nr:HD-GYP domain-containing protein [Rhodocyclaceae bacterium]